MRLSWPARVLRVFLALWFVLSIGEPSVVHVCPMHGGAMAELEGHAAMPGMPRMPAMPGMPRHAPHDHCPCMACCVGCAPTGLASPTVTISEQAIVVAASVGLATSNTPSLGDAAHRQPPGTGPPRV